MSDREDDQTVDTVEIREVVGIVYNHNALEEMATQLVAAGSTAMTYPSWPIGIRSSKNSA